MSSSYSTNNIQIGTYLPSLVNNIVNDVFVFFFQLAEFEDGGLALRLICFHLIADPTSATTFLKAWADTTFAGKMLQPPLFQPLPQRT